MATFHAVNHRSGAQHSSTKILYALEQKVKATVSHLAFRD
jgi:hypothetical protein